MMSFYCFYCQLWTAKCRLVTAFKTVIYVPKALPEVFDMVLSTPMLTNWYFVQFSCSQIFDDKN